MLHKTLLIPQVIQQDAAVEIHVGVIEEIHAGFFEDLADGVQDAVKPLFLRPGGQKVEAPAHQEARDIAAEAPEAQVVRQRVPSSRSRYRVVASI